MTNHRELLSAEYDDRMLPRFALVRDATRTQLILGGTAIGVVLVIAGFGISQRGLDLLSLRDLGVVLLIAFLIFVGALMVVLISMPRHYVIRADVLEYPRWGGLRRGKIMLAHVKSLRREGRDESSATVFLVSDDRRLLTIPEDLLADPSKFRDALMRAGLKEEASRFRRGGT